MKCLSDMINGITTRIYMTDSIVYITLVSEFSADSQTTKWKGKYRLILWDYRSCLTHACTHMHRHTNTHTHARTHTDPHTYSTHKTHIRYNTTSKHNMMKYVLIMGSLYTYYSYWCRKFMKSLHQHYHYVDHSIPNIWTFPKHWKSSSYIFNFVVEKYVYWRLYWAMR